MPTYGAASLETDVLDQLSEAKGFEQLKISEVLNSSDITPLLATVKSNMATKGSDILVGTEDEKLVGTTVSLLTRAIKEARPADTELLPPQLQTKIATLRQSYLQQKQQEEKATTKNTALQEKFVGLYTRLGIKKETKPELYNQFQALLSSSEIVKAQLKDITLDDLVNYIKRNKNKKLFDDKPELRELVNKFRENYRSDIDATITEGIRKAKEKNQPNSERLDEPKFREALQYALRRSPISSDALSEILVQAAQAQYQEDAIAALEKITSLKKYGDVIAFFSSNLPPRPVAAKPATPPRANRPSDLLAALDTALQSHYQSAEAKNAAHDLLSSEASKPHFNRLIQDAGNNTTVLANELHNGSKNTKFAAVKVGLENLETLDKAIQARDSILANLTNINKNYLKSSPITKEEINSPTFLDALKDLVKEQKPAQVSKLVVDLFTPDSQANINRTDTKTGKAQDWLYEFAASKRKDELRARTRMVSDDLNSATRVATAEEKKKEDRAEARHGVSPTAAAGAAARTAAVEVPARTPDPSAELKTPPPVPPSITATQPPAETKTAAPAAAAAAAKPPLRPTIKPAAPDPADDVIQKLCDALASEIPPETVKLELGTVLNKFRLNGALKSPIYFQDGSSALVKDLKIAILGPEVLSGVKQSNLTTLGLNVPISILKGERKPTEAKVVSPAIPGDPELKTAAAPTSASGATVARPSVAEPTAAAASVAPPITPSPVTPEHKEAKSFVPNALAIITASAGNIQSKYPESKPELAALFTRLNTPPNRHLTKLLNKFEQDGNFDSKHDEPAHSLATSVMNLFDPAKSEKDIRKEMKGLDQTSVDAIVRETNTLRTAEIVAKVEQQVLSHASSKYPQTDPDLDKLTNIGEKTSLSKAIKHLVTVNKDKEIVEYTQFFLDLFNPNLSKSEVASRLTQAGININSAFVNVIDRLREAENAAQAQLGKDHIISGAIDEFIASSPESKSYADVPINYSTLKTALEEKPIKDILNTLLDSSFFDDEAKLGTFLTQLLDPTKTTVADVETIINAKMPSRPPLLEPAEINTLATKISELNTNAAAKKSALARAAEEKIIAAAITNVTATAAHYVNLNTALTTAAPIQAALKELIKKPGYQTEAQLTTLLQSVLDPDKDAAAVQNILHDAGVTTSLNDSSAAIAALNAAAKTALTANPDAVQVSAKKAELNNLLVTLNREIAEAETKLQEAKTLVDHWPRHDSRRAELVTAMDEAKRNFDLATTAMTEAKNIYDTQINLSTVTLPAHLQPAALTELTNRTTNASQYLKAALTHANKALAAREIAPDPANIKLPSLALTDERRRRRFAYCRHVLDSYKSAYLLAESAKGSLSTKAELAKAMSQIEALMRDMQTKMAELNTHPTREMQKTYEWLQEMLTNFTQLHTQMEQTRNAPELTHELHFSDNGMTLTRSEFEAWRASAGNGTFTPPIAGISTTRGFTDPMVVRKQLVDEKFTVYPPGILATPGSGSATTSSSNQMHYYEHEFKIEKNSKRTEFQIGVVELPKNVSDREFLLKFLEKNYKDNFPDAAHLDALKKAVMTLPPGVDEHAIRDLLRKVNIMTGVFKKSQIDAAQLYKEFRKYANENGTMKINAGGFRDVELPHVDIIAAAHELLEKAMTHSTPQEKIHIGVKHEQLAIALDALIKAQNLQNRVDFQSEFTASSKQVAAIKNNFGDRFEITKAKTPQLDRMTPFVAKPVQAKALPQKMEENIVLATQTNITRRPR